MEKFDKEEILELAEWNKFLLAEKVLFLTGIIIHYLFT
jgi:hypothetical protein